MSSLISCFKKFPDFLDALTMWNFPSRIVKNFEARNKFMLCFQLITALFKWVAKQQAITRHASACLAFNETDLLLFSTIACSIMNTDSWKSLLSHRFDE